MPQDAEGRSDQLDRALADAQRQERRERAEDLARQARIDNRLAEMLAGLDHADGT